VAGSRFAGDILGRLAVHHEVHDARFAWRQQVQAAAHLTAFDAARRPRRCRSIDLSHARDQSSIFIVFDFPGAGALRV